MMRNMNQVCGILAMIGVACLAAFGSAGDRIVSAAPGQIGEAGDTGQAIAIGGCNRCAWNYKNFILPNHPPGQDVVILPRGTSGAVRFAQVSGFGAPFYVADCFEPGASGEFDSFALTQLGVTEGHGVRFVDGLIARFPTVTMPHDVYVGIWYRLD